MARALPRPRSPLATRPSFPLPAVPGSALATVRRWYEEELGWPTTGTEPVELVTGVRFDVLEMPADAGRAVLRRVPRTGPVALLRPELGWAGRGEGGRAGWEEEGGLRSERGEKAPEDRPKLLMLIAAGGAEELPEILEWLEWGTLAADLTARGAGGRMPAPALPSGCLASDGCGTREAAGWVRPPLAGYEAENSLPATGVGAGTGDGGGVPDLVRLVSTAATECHRARLVRARNGQSDRADGDQPLAFSYASRMSAGTRPRSLTL